MSCAYADETHKTSPGVLSAESGYGLCFVFLIHNEVKLFA